MLRRTLGAAMVAVASVVVVPYAVALLTNILYGWPLGSRRYRRAFDPRKVLALNYTLLMHLTILRYAGLAFRWKRFYRNAGRDRLIKNLVYGSNGNSLDVYLPTEARDLTSLPAASKNALKPIVIFVYGGSWGSGDKDMYGLLCAQLADRLSAVIICPNYSTYPKGFVDDMVQDISDAVAYAHKFAADFGADKDRIMLIGHSAGAHLAAMTVLELSMKLLSDKPELLAETRLDTQQRTDSLEVSIVDASAILSASTASLEIHERHFNGDSNSGQGLASSTFCVIDNVDQGGNNRGADATRQGGDGDVSIVSESFYMIGDNNSILVTTQELAPLNSEANEQTEPSTKDAAAEMLEQETEMETPSTDDAAVVAAAAAAGTTTRNPNETEELLSSILLVVGLAGVYDIAPHYIHEMSRGVEDISTMARAMYGPKRFDRFSPTVIVQSLPMNAVLPPVHLIHGGSDITVPVSSSTRFGDAIWKRGSSPVTATIINGCGHTDVCLDLMEPGRAWHDVVFSEIRSSFNRHVVVTRPPADKH